jgi:hypothetical protein
LGKIVFRCFSWWKNLEGNARVDWTRQKFILRKRVTHTPPVHPFLHRILVHSPPPLLLTWR